MSATKTDLAKTLGLGETASAAEVYAAVRLALDVAERPGGIDRDEVREAEVAGHRFRLGFVRRAKFIAWEGEQQRLSHAAALALPECANLQALASDNPGEAAAAVAALTAQMSNPQWGEHYTRMADVAGRRHELHREVVRFGVRGWEIPDCAPAETETSGRDVLLTEDSVDRLEVRGLVEPVAQAVLRHWLLSAAEKKS